MSALLENAIGSIKIGIQDFGSADAHRHLSAVRNYYAGILLLAKAVLVHRFPTEDPDLLIAAHLKPKAGPDGKLKIVPASHVTIDFRTIGQRFKDLAIPFQPDLLSELNGIRNDIEHKFSLLSKPAIIESIAKGFPAAGQLFRLLNLDPANLLGEEWTEMLNSEALFKEELEACRTSIKAINWLSATVAAGTFACTECGSNLVQQLNPENKVQQDAELTCRACGVELDVGDVIEKTVEDALWFEAHLRTKDSAEDGPYFECPDCQKVTYIDFEAACANCGFSSESSGACAICHTTIPIAEMLACSGRALCSYHRYLMEKDD